MDIKQDQELAMKDLARRYPHEFPKTLEKVNAEKLDNLPEGVKETLIRRHNLKGEK